MFGSVAGLQPCAPLLLEEHCHDRSSIEFWRPYSVFRSHNDPQMGPKDDRLSLVASRDCSPGSWRCRYLLGPSHLQAHSIRYLPEAILFGSSNHITASILDALPGC